MQKKSALQQCVLALCTGILVALAFLLPQLFFLMWFSFVPLLIALEKVSVRRAYFIGLLAGCVLSSCATYWIDDFIANLKGYDGPLRAFLAFLFWLYSAHVLALVALFYCAIRRISRVSPFVVFPLVLCLLFAYFPSMFPVQLGASQSYFLIALQTIEFTGVYGLDFILGLANIFIFSLVKNKGKAGLASGLAGAALILWFAYGVYALSSWEQRVASLDTMAVGVIQTNDSPSVKLLPPGLGFTYAYPKEMAYSEALAGEGIELIIWPEARLRAYFSHPHVAEAYRYYAKSFAAELIFQDSEIENENGVLKRFNSSVLINSKGEEQARYRKIKRIPVGEYLPVLGENEWAKRWLRDYVGDFFSDLQAGNHRKIYQLNTKQAVFGVPLICYELIFPRFVAEAPAVTSQPMFLLGQSNNSWFGPTRQPFQHLYAASLRSVENRLPLVYSANNGPSALISPTGRILAQTGFNEEGAYRLELPLLKVTNKTLFGRFPNGFLMIALFALLLCLIESGGRLIVSKYSRIRARA